VIPLEKAGANVPALGSRFARVAFELGGACVTVVRYVFVVVVSEETTTIVTSVVAALTLMGPDAAPEGTETPFTVMAAVGSDATGVKVMLVAE
jgi:hypothetical protein